MSDRIRKVNELIREEASRSISEHLNSPGLITVKAVETDRDLKHAVVWVSILGDEKKTRDLLMESARDIEREVRSRMSSKYTPKLEFKIDHSEEYVARIEKLLHEK